MSNVKCSVHSCEYYGNGDVCTAKGIEVNNNHNPSFKGADMEIGDIGCSCDAMRSPETMCKTFRPKGQ